MRNYGAKQPLTRITPCKDFLNEKIKDPRYYWIILRNEIIKLLTELGWKAEGISELREYFH